MFTERILELLQQSIAIKQALTANADLISEIAERMVQALLSGGTIYTFGNGGSAADAQHIATELSGRYLLERGPLPVIALATNVPLITAIGNDYGFEAVFARQLQGVLTNDDLVIGLSTSGRSLNVLNGLATAREKGAVTVGLTGGDAGRMPTVTDLCLVVPSTVTPRIQEAHMLIGHILCDLVEQKIFGNV